jgi:ArsR family transcriptional regulator, virulence genes transcriptional regulator
MDKHIRERAGLLFSALGHTTRLRIVELLLEGERSVNEIAAALSLQQSSTSQHLAVLTRAGVLVVEQRGAMRCYRIRGPRIGRIMALIEEFCTVHSLYGSEGEEEVTDRVSTNGADIATADRETLPLARQPG